MKKKSLAIRKDISGLRVSGKSRAPKPRRRLGFSRVMHGTEREPCTLSKEGASCKFHVPKFATNIEIDLKCRLSCTRNVTYVAHVT
jgi:hypothetical protein